MVIISSVNRLGKRFQGLNFKFVTGQCGQSGACMPSGIYFGPSLVFIEIGKWSLPHWSSKTSQVV